MSVIRSHDEDMERIRLEHENRMAESREQTRREIQTYKERNKQNRVPIITSVVICCAIVVVIYVVTVAIRADGREKNRDAPLERQTELTRETQCLDDGGGWLTEEMVVGDKGLCVFPGKDKTN